MPLETICKFNSVQFTSVVQSSPTVTPWTEACQAPLSITNSQSLLKFMSIESVMPSIYLILCHPLLLPPSMLPSIRVFSNESVLRIRRPKYQSFSFSISASNEYSGWIPSRMDWLDLLAEMQRTICKEQLVFSVIVKLKPFTTDWDLNPCTGT